MPKKIIRGVAFDMDGTLTVPVLDFQLMRQRVGVPQTADILDTINAWAPERRERAHLARGGRHRRGFCAGVLCAQEPQWRVIAGVTKVLLACLCLP